MNTYKVVLIGSVFVGKSSIAKNFLHNKFNSQTESTIGCSFFRKQLTINNQTICLDIVDSAGSNRFHTLLPMYIKGAHAVLLVYDITSLESFNKIDYLLSEIKKNNNEAIIMLVGNKLDLSNRIIMYEEGKLFAHDHDLLFRECSACTGVNISDIFTEIASILIVKNPPLPKTIVLTPKKEKSCCY